ncbi:glutaminase A [Spirulina sp. 06S082]|uniref:glutaminase A n=1 Tax=Spirulina sp. 06S082 TaxID=3110248 RepID=UPI002B1F7381|nr:glutaminase A [Spirulina sp. 06S082]MEA5467977.1 glutaminase A [Spirulina sp. 06S082]
MIVDSNLPLIKPLQTTTTPPTTTPFQSYLTSLHEKYLSLNDGAIADYIPELAAAKQEWFGISVVTTAGKIFEVGDSDRHFTLQSISKALVYGMALEDCGREIVRSKVSIKSAGESANTVALDEQSKLPYNPMVNAGAIAVTDLIKGNSTTDRLNRILKKFYLYTGREVNISFPVFLSEKSAGHRHRALAHLLLNYGAIGDRIEETLDLYFQHSSILVNAKDLAVIGATLANGGINPITKERAIDERYVRDVMSMMIACGLDDYSGEWAYEVGIPAKSGVGGGILAAVPSKLGMGVFSPLLDATGNSIRGIEVCKDLSRKFGLHLFDTVKADKNLNEWLDSNESADGW